MIIILLGYMGSGKSTIGRVLAKKLNYNFADLDDYIEEKEQSSIAQIFKTKGEIYFRKKESTYLREIVGKDRLVLALGGGAPCYAGNMNFLNKNNNAMSIYLDASIISLVTRLKKEKDKRPLISHLKTDEDLTEFISKHLFERRQYYNQASFKISVDDKSVDDLVKEVILNLF